MNIITIYNLADYQEAHTLVNKLQSTGFVTRGPYPQFEDEKETPWRVEAMTVKDWQELKSWEIKTK